MMHRRICRQARLCRLFSPSYTRAYNTPSPEPPLQRVRKPIKEDRKKTLFADDEDPEEINSELRKMLAMIDEEFGAVTSQENETMENEDIDMGELMEQAKIGKERKDKMREGNIPGLAGLRPNEALLPTDDTSSGDSPLELFFAELEKQHRSLELEAKEVETWPEWHEYQKESDLEEEKIREAWDSSSAPVTKASADKLTKEIAEMDMAVRKKWLYIAAERFRREMAQGLHPRMAEERDRIRQARASLRPNPTKEEIITAPQNPAEKAVRAVRSLLPE